MMLPRTSFELFKKERFYLEKFDALCLHAGRADHSGPETDADPEAGEAPAVHPEVGRKCGLYRLEAEFFDEVLSGQRPYESNLIRK